MASMATASPALPATQPPQGSQAYPAAIPVNFPPASPFYYTAMPPGAMTNASRTPTYIFSIPSGMPPGGFYYAPQPGQMPQVFLPPSAAPMMTTSIGSGPLNTPATAAITGAPAVDGSPKKGTFCSLFAREETDN